MATKTFQVNDGRGDAHGAKYPGRFPQPGRGPQLRNYMSWRFRGYGEGAGRTRYDDRMRGRRW